MTRVSWPGLLRGADTLDWALFWKSVYFLNFFFKYPILGQNSFGCSRHISFHPSALTPTYNHASFFGCPRRLNTALHTKRQKSKPPNFLTDSFVLSLSLQFSLSDIHTSIFGAWVKGQSLLSHCSTAKSTPPMLTVTTVGWISPPHYNKCEFFPWTNLCLKKSILWAKKSKGNLSMPQVCFYKSASNYF